MTNLVGIKFEVKLETNPSFFLSLFGNQDFKKLCNFPEVVKSATRLSLSGLYSMGLGAQCMQLKLNVAGSQPQLKWMVLLSLNKVVRASSNHAPIFV